MPHVFSELAYGSLEIGGLFLPPPLVGVALLQLPLYPQQLGLVAFLHHTTQHRRVVTTYRYVCGVDLTCTHTAALSPHLQHAADLHNPVLLLLVTLRAPPYAQSTPLYAQSAPPTYRVPHSTHRVPPSSLSLYRVRVRVHPLPLLRRPRVRLQKWPFW